jgi:hypothetical protein
MEVAQIQTETGPKRNWRSLWPFVVLASLILPAAAAAQVEERGSFTFVLVTEQPGFFFPPSINDAGTAAYILLQGGNKLPTGVQVATWNAV